jgi:phosphatidylserine/phosphatidylglycerophosphate/cardiolipin synthase-like enzyme
VASQNNVSAATAMAAFAAANLPTTAALQVPFEALAASHTFQKFFDAKTVKGNFTIQPLLTPDNYLEHVLPLIQSATKSFYMQTQYIHPGSGPDDADHNKLIDAVQALVEKGVDVRLICSTYETADWVEKLADAGLDTSVLRVQPRVHNKGIVVDGGVVMVSSQNWSADGTLRNRDAGLIIHNEEAAGYFQQIFLHDWNNLTSVAPTA